MKLEKTNDDGKKMGLVVNPIAIKSEKSDVLFENLPELVKPNVAASVLEISVKTIYDWRYRQKEKKIPADLFLKINRLLYLRTHVLRRWIASQNPTLWD